MLRTFESITALKKAATKREAERKELADVIEQEKLIEIKGTLLSTRCDLSMIDQAGIRSSSSRYTLDQLWRGRRWMGTLRYIRMGYGFDQKVMGQKSVS